MSRLLLYIENDAAKDSSALLCFYEMQDKKWKYPRQEMHGLRGLIVACRIVYLPYLIGLSIATMHYEVIFAHVRNNTLTRLGLVPVPVPVPGPSKCLSMSNRQRLEMFQNSRLYANLEGMCSQVIPVTLFVKWNSKQETY